MKPPTTFLARSPKAYRTISEAFDAVENELRALLECLKDAEKEALQPELF